MVTCDVCGKAITLEDKGFSTAWGYSSVHPRTGEIIDGEGITIAKWDVHTGECALKLRQLVGEGQKRTAEWIFDKLKTKPGS